MMRLGLVCAGLTLGFGGCEQTHFFKPFDADRTSVSLDAQQRIVVSALRGPAGSQRRIICAEPSPDAISALASSLATDLTGKVPATEAGTAGTTEAELAVRRSVAEQVAYVGVRNSTIQLLRDGLYRSCEAYLNGAIGDFG